MSETKPEPLTEAEEQTLRDQGVYGRNLAFTPRVWATLDSLRAQLARAEAAIVELGRETDLQEQSYGALVTGLQAQLTAATDRSERAEAERDSARSALGASWQSMLDKRDAAQRDAKRYREALEALRVRAVSMGDGPPWLDAAVATIAIVDAALAPSEKEDDRG